MEVANNVLHSEKIKFIKKYANMIEKADKNPLIDEISIDLCKGLNYNNDKNIERRKIKMKTEEIKKVEVNTSTDLSKIKNYYSNSNKSNKKNNFKEFLITKIMIKNYQLIAIILRFLRLTQTINI